MQKINVNTKYILPIPKITIEDDTECIKKKGEIRYYLLIFMKSLKI